MQCNTTVKCSLLAMGAAVSLICPFWVACIAGVHIKKWVTGGFAPWFPLALT